MFAFSKANHTTSNNGKVIGSAISSSTIDMNSGVITSHSMPTVPSDVANKEYVDLRSDSVVIVNLTGTSYTTISSALTGNFRIYVSNIVTNGPCATFSLVKNNSSVYPGYTRNSSISGTTTQEKLDISWDPGTGIALKKTGNQYNGQYRIKISRQD
jgi:hypothetical protein